MLASATSSTRTDYVFRAPATDHELPRFLAGARYRFLKGFRHQRSPEVPCPEHCQDFVQLIYHASGWGATSVEGGQPLSLEPGSVVVYLPGVLHDQTFSAPMEDWCIHLFIVRRHPPLLPSHWYVPQLSDPLLIREIKSLVEVGSPASPWEQLTCDCRVGAVVTAVIALSESPPSAVPASVRRYAQRAYQYMQTHYRTLHRIEEVAEHLGISHSHLRHLFRQCYGLSLIEALTRIRVEQAEALLRSTTLSLTAVATQCGFANERYFSTVFRRFCGCPPGAYRLQHR